MVSKTRQKCVSKPHTCLTPIGTQAGALAFKADAWESLCLHFHSELATSLFSFSTFFLFLHFEPYTAMPK